MWRRVAKCSLLITCLLFATVLLPFPCQASETFRQALEASRSGDLERAVSLWTRIINRDPKSYAAYVNRGSTFMWGGHVFEAIMDWHKARELSPPFGYGYYSGLFITEAPRKNPMLNYVSSIELDPDHVASVYMIGALYLDVGQKKKAAKLFRRSIELTRNPLLKNHFEYWAKSIESQPGE